METKNLTWYVENNADIIPTSYFFAGSFIENEEVNIKIYLWNNRFGQADEVDIDKLKLKIEFETIEDMIYLENFTYNIDGSNSQKLIVDNGVGYIEIDKKLSGKKNDGSFDKNPENYIIINLSIPIVKGMKETIKNFYISCL